MSTEVPSNPEYLGPAVGVAGQTRKTRGIRFFDSEWDELVSDGPGQEQNKLVAQARELQNHIQASSRQLRLLDFSFPIHFSLHSATTDWWYMPGVDCGQDLLLRQREGGFATNGNPQLTCTPCKFWKGTK